MVLLERFPVLIPHLLRSFLDYVINSFDLWLASSLVLREEFLLVLFGVFLEVDLIV